MPNPLRSEAEAFRFLILVIGYFAAIVAANLLGGRWAGAAVFVVLTAVVLYLYLKGKPRPPEGAGPDEKSG